jgi:hypothetical protein
VAQREYFGLLQAGHSNPPQKFGIPTVLTNASDFEADISRRRSVSFAQHLAKFVLPITTVPGIAMIGSSSVPDLAWC